ncbi:fungal-specific transcription factor domain-containing protein [Scheffersomyces xylosifermentans]|uniref:fungal-specific transcription factor domain-containing protein n=1 Tax=Scheffersomyces xylosifermentans TaxID=1304137 RepID=UPI00315C5621
MSPHNEQTVQRTKPKTTKSRNGCLTCKRKRLKCDETKPGCLNCRKRKIECGGYATNFKWRSDISSVPTAVAPEKTSIKRHLELASLSVTGKTIQDIKIENDLISQGFNPHSYKKRRLTGESSKTQMSHSMSLDAKSRRSNSDSMDDHNFVSTDTMSLRRSFSTNSHNTFPPEIFNLREEYSKSMSNRLDSLADVAVDEMKRSPSVSEKDVNKPQPSPATQLPFSPNFSDFLTNTRAPGANDDANSHKLMDKSYNGTSSLLSKEAEILNEINLTPSLSAIINFAFNTEDSKDLALENKINDSESPVASISTPLSTISDNFLNRSLMKTSESEQILHLYSQYTCSIMSIKNGAKENPWRSMIIPLATKYSCLFNSIASMTLFHLAGNSELEGNSSDLRAKGYGYMRRCILELASGLTKMDSEGGDSEELPADIALTTCLNLAVSESWDVQTSSGIAHLKGAKSMIQKVLTLLKDQQKSLSKKRKEIELDPSSTDSDRQYNELVISERKELEKKLVLVDRSEMERLFEPPVIHGGDGSVARKSDKLSSIPIPKSLQFLFNIWIYFEVLAQMTTDTNYDDKGIDLVATITTMLQTSHNQRSKEKRMSASSISSENGDHDDSRSIKSESGDSSIADSVQRNGFNFFDNFDSFSYNTEYVDPLLGCAQSLFSIMGRVANLIAKVRKMRRKEAECKNIKNAGSSRNTLKTISQASELKQQLTCWKSTITASMVNQSNMYEDNNGNAWDIPSCIATAEAYKFATLIYLHQAVPEIPSPSSHSLAEKIFILLASIPSTSDLSTVHIFPLLVASCEAEQGEEREWCESRWSILSQKMWIGNIDRALQVVKEVWKRKDEYLKKKRRGEFEEGSKKAPGAKEDEDSLRNISTQISGLMSVINNDQNSTPIDDIRGGISSKLHWSTVMKEWGWEVLLG